MLEFQHNGALLSFARHCKLHDEAVAFESGADSRRTAIFPEASSLIFSIDKPSQNTDSYMQRPRLWFACQVLHLIKLGRHLVNESFLQRDIELKL